MEAGGKYADAGHPKSSGMRPTNLQVRGPRFKAKEMRNLFLLFAFGLAPCALRLELLISVAVTKDEANPDSIGKDVGFAPAF